MEFDPKSLKIIALGGLGEIGMNCLALETKDSLIVIDCGVLFTELETFGVDYIIPNFTYLKERKDKLKGYIITHAHEDHIGALPFAFKEGLRAPIYCTDFASRLILDRLKERGQEKNAELHIYKQTDSIKIGNFEIQTYPVNHSIVESIALMITTPAGRVLHTGDFKIDPDPFYGKPLDLNWFQTQGEKGIDLLLSDSTNVEVDHPSGSEKEIKPNLEKIIENSTGLVVLTLFSSHIPRIANILEIAERLDKKVVLSGRSMMENMRHATESGYLKHGKQVIVPVEELSKIGKQNAIVLSTGSQGEYRSALWRISQGEHRSFDVGPGDGVIVSSRFIPGNEQSISRMINNLFRLGANVFYEPIHHIHVSGHATKPELKQMLKAVNPKNFVPIHGEFRHLVIHSQVAEECGVKKGHSLVAQNGDILELKGGAIKKIDAFENPFQLIDEKGTTVSKTVLRHRRQLAEAGAAAFGYFDNEIEFIQKGVFDEEANPDLIAGIKNEIAKILEKDLSGGGNTYAEAMRIEVRRFLSRFEDKRRPIVFPIGFDDKSHS